ncbi:MAG: SDR family oxidoreductase [Deltaproteobacteria bacterium]
MRFAVTGAFSFTGRYIAERLLERGERVVTLTNHPDRRDPFAGRVEIQPYIFERPEEMVRTLRGVSTLFNTYWVRFPHGGMDYERAVENSKILIRCAREAGVRRFVHISITNPSLDSRYRYFSGKARVEQALRQSGLSYAILRPTVVFGDGGILLHNIAWLLRKFPIFALPGRGDFRLQPVYVEDVADLAVEAASRSENEIFDAAGPEIFTFAELVELLAQTAGSRAKILRTPPMVSLALAKIAGLMVRDVILTRGEVESLMESLVVSSQPARGKTKLSNWLRQNSDTLGRTYRNELDMHFRRGSSRLAPNPAR